MRVLLDECIPRKFKSELIGQECSTVPECGLAGKKNGELLAMAEKQGFDAFITLDRGIQYQQNLAGRAIAVLIIRANSNRLTDLLPLVTECLDQLVNILPGSVTTIG